MVITNHKAMQNEFTYVYVGLKKLAILIQNFWSIPVMNY